MAGEQRQCGTVLARGMRSEILVWRPGQVLKLYLPGRTANQVAAEAAFTRHAYDQGLPVPAVHGVLERSGRHGVVLDRIDGPALDRVLIGRMWSAARIGRDLALLHARIHAACGEGLPAQHATLTRRIRAHASPLTEAAKAVAVKRLAMLPGGKALCHSDLHLQNVLSAPERGLVVIDWDAPVEGNPVGDVARTYLVLIAGPFHVPAVVRPVANLACRVLARSYLGEYCRLSAWEAGWRGHFGTWLWLNAAARLAEGIEPERRWLVSLVQRGLDGTGEPAGDAAI